MLFGKKLKFGRKIALSIFAVGLIPIVLSLVLTYFKGTYELRKSIGGDFKVLAEQTSSRVTMLLKMELAEINSVIVSADIVNFLEKRNRKYKNLGAEELTALMVANERLWKENNEFKLDMLINNVSTRLRGFVSQSHEKDTQFKFFITDKKGALVATSNGFVQYLYTSSNWWQEAYNNGQGKRIISDLYYNKEISAFVFNIITPVYNYKHELQGFLWQGYLKEFLEAAINNIKIADTGHAMLMNLAGKVLVCPVLPTGSHMTDEFVLNGLRSNNSGWVLADKDGHGGFNSIVAYAPVKGLAMLSDFSLAEELSAPQWFTVIRQDPKEFNRPLYSLFFYHLAAGLVLAVILSYIGFEVAKRLVSPLEQLRIGVIKIGQGNLDHRLLIETGDEFEELSKEFNKMAGRLNRSHSAMLEQVVQARTRELSTLNKIANTVNKTMDLQEVLDAALENVVEALEADAGAIRVYHPDQANLVINAFHGIPADLVRLNEAVRFGSQLAGKVAKYKKSITINCEGAESNNLFEAQSIYDNRFEMITCVPLLSKHELVGTMSVASKKKPTLKDKDVELLQAMANMIGTAIGNANAYENSEKVAALEEREWMTRELHDGVAQDLAYLKMQLKLLCKKIYSNSQESIEDDVKKLSRLVEHSYESVRDLLGAFKPGVRNKDEFSYSINAFIQKMEDESNLRVVKNIQVDLNSLSSLVFVHMFRIIQESVANARKHSGADELFLDIINKDEKTVLQIRDNGKGFDLNQIESGMGISLGLTIMQERTEKIGGSFSIDSVVGKGTTVTVTVPA